MSMLRPKTVNFQNTWQTHCQPRFLSLFSARPEEVKLSAFELYANVYELCVAVPADNNHQRLLQSISDLLQTRAQEMRAEIQDAPAASLLKAYLHNWQLFRDSSRALNAVCRYLNKCLSTATAKTPSSIKLKSESIPRFFSVQSVLEACQVIWREVVLRELSGLLEIVIESWTEPFIDEVIESYMWSKDDSLITALRSHLPSIYSTKSHQFLATSPITAYIPFAAALLEIEHERLNRLLPAELAASLLELCEGELIGKHVGVLTEEFQVLLEGDEYAQLMILLSLLERNAEAMTALQAALTAHILCTGKASISQSGLTGLLQVTEKTHILLTSGFNDSSEMISCANAALSTLLNHHLPHPADCLTAALMSALQKEREQIQLSLLHLLPLFAHFDALYASFQESLARAICFPCHNPPLLHPDTASHLIEALAALPSCTAERACHLRQMLRDASARDLIRWDARDEFTISLQLLTSHSWPRSFEGTCAETDWFSAGPEALEMYSRGFREVQQGKKLQWCPQLTSVEVKDTHTGKVYLMTPKQLRLALGDREEDDDDEETRLVKSVIVGKTSTSTTAEVIVKTVPRDTSTDAEVISLIPIKKSITSTAPSSTTPASSTTNTDLTHLLQCLIVNAMKRSPRSSPPSLHKQTLSAAQSLRHGHAFVPTDEAIEGAVKGLIEKGFLEYNKADNVYIYLA